MSDVVVVAVVAAVAVAVAVAVDHGWLAEPCYLSDIGLSIGTFEDLTAN